MLTLYRIVHRRYRTDPFSGMGGLYHNSRWASQGQRVSYAADHLALATLEKLAGVQRADLMAEMVYAKAVMAPEHVTQLSAAERPDDWDAVPAPESTRAVGDAWLDRGDYAVLQVPSVVLPEGANYVINSEHPAAATLTVETVAPLLLDNRVLARIGT